MFASVKVMGRGLALLCLLGSSPGLRSQQNCSLFTDSAHVRACRLYNAADSMVQGSAICQRYLDSAVRICPDYADAWHELSVPYLKRGDYQTWWKLMEKAVELKPLVYLGDRGWCRFKFLRDYSGALHDLRRLDTLTDFNPGQSGDGDYNLYIVMALCERELGHHAAAMHYFTLGIDSVQSRKGGEWLGLFDYLHRAVTRLRSGDYAGALADLDEQEKKNDQYAECSYYRGLALRALGKSREAQAALERAKRLYTTTGYHLADPYCELQDQVYLRDIERALGGPARDGSTRF